MLTAAERRIIVGLTSGDVDPHAVRTAMDLTRAFDGTLYVIDVQDGADPGAADDRGIPRMQGAYFALSKSGGLPDEIDVRIVVVAGDPAEQLVRLADRSTDLLVVSRAGTPDAGREIAWNCMANAGCTVVVVPPRLDPDHGDERSRKELAGAR